MLGLVNRFAYFGQRFTIESPGEGGNDDDLAFGNDDGTHDV
ncbi:hypothetical protein Pla52n_05720 [Stieleria varia]|uniref:Uncharacterized protein n=1 Tax=Stieleria varia TaxID=2528005 RepID=A0A5C6BBT8_9BACT|nr:hypothetical protein Pla52n_05720 [Stieleria varia]